MPINAREIDPDALRAAFRAHKDGQPKFTRRMAIVIADLFDSWPMSVVWRLEKMKLIKQGSWGWFKDNGGITKAHIREVLDDLEADRRALRPTPPEQKGGE